MNDALKTQRKKVASLMGLAAVCNKLTYCKYRIVEK